MIYRYEITTTILPEGFPGEAYSYTLAATGGDPPYTWSWFPLDSPLPPGLAIDPETGTISGIPTTLGYYPFTAQVTDIYGSTASLNLYMQVVDNSIELLWRKTYATSSEGQGVATDTAGNIIATGIAGADILTIKYNPSGVMSWYRTWSYAGYQDGSSDIVADPAGNIYVAGYAQTSSTSSYSPMLLKYDAGGNLIWSRLVKNSGGSAAQSLAVDAFGNCFVLVPGSLGGSINKYDAAGHLLWNKTDYSSGPLSGIALDQQGNLYVVSNDSTQAVGLIRKMDPAGKVLWSGWLGQATLTSLAVTPWGDVYAAGYTPGTQYQVAKWNTSGVLQWRQNPIGWGYAWGIAADELGNAYVTGQMSSPTPNLHDSVTIKYDSTGRQLWFERTSGGAGIDERAQDVAVDKDGQVAVVTSVGNFPYRMETILYRQADADLDGFGCTVDCLDMDPSSYPGAEEICDGKDNNCDGTIDEGCPSPLTVTAAAGVNGAITPSGNVSVYYGADQSFVVNPSLGYMVQDVVVDGVSVGPVISYNLHDVTAAHVISASFMPIQYHISAFSGVGGNITPAGDTAVGYGVTQTYSIAPATGYNIAYVFVDGKNVGAVSTYTFTKVTDDHTINASFIKKTFTIQAYAYPWGTMAPVGTVTVQYGSDQSFTMTPNDGYHVSDVLVDGVSVGKKTTYTFVNITANHSIYAYFEFGLEITATAGSGGSILPSGTLCLPSGGSQTYTITPNPNYRILDVKVDGVSVGPVSSYTFLNVAAGHTIEATFTGFTAVTVVQPNGGEVIPAGLNPYVIRWGAPAAAVKFNVSYSLNNGKGYTPIKNGVTGYSYNWTVPQPTTNQTQCLVKVIGLDTKGKVIGTDISNQVFTIEVLKVTAPNGGEPWKAGATYPITWIFNGTSTATKTTLWYSTNAGSTWTKIADLTNNPGTYNWNTPATVNSSQCLVKVNLFNKSASLGLDSSDGVFTISP